MQLLPDAGQITHGLHSSLGKEGPHWEHQTHALTLVRGSRSLAYTKLKMIYKSSSLSAQAPINLKWVHLLSKLPKGVNCFYHIYMVRLTLFLSCSQKHKHEGNDFSIKIALHLIHSLKIKHPRGKDGFMTSWEIQLLVPSHYS